MLTESPGEAGQETQVIRKFWLQGIVNVSACLTRGRLLMSPWFQYLAVLYEAFSLHHSFQRTVSGQVGW